MEVVKNNLGGDMPQDRLDRIKAAWMERWGTSEADWEVFQQQQPFTTNVNELKSRKVAGSAHEFDSVVEESQKMEFIFCPDEREMGFRYQTKAQHFEHLAEKNALDNPVQAAEYRQEARFWKRLSRDCFNQAADNRRKL